MSFTGCNNERQTFVKLSYSAIDNVLTNLLPAGLQGFSGAQCQECDDSKQGVVLPRSNSPLGLGYSAANFLVPQILTHEDAKNATVCRE